VVNRSPRWEGDERGRGVGDAGELAEGAAELVAAFRQPEWVAEHPEAHLLPHVEAWCRRDQRLGLTGARGDDGGAFVLELDWRGAPGAVGEAREAVFSLVGSFAESATYVRQRREATLQFEVGTGELAGAHFAPHGHVVVITVAGVL
jgi:hypothetical protein